MGWTDFVKTIQKKNGSSYIEAIGAAKEPWLAYKEGFANDYPEYDHKKLLAVKRKERVGAAKEKKRAEIEKGTTFYKGGKETDKSGAVGKKVGKKEAAEDVDEDKDYDYVVTTVTTKKRKRGGGGGTSSSLPLEEVDVVEKPKPKRKRYTPTKKSKKVLMVNQEENVEREKEEKEKFLNAEKDYKKVIGWLGKEGEEEQNRDSSLTHSSSSHPEENDECEIHKQWTGGYALV